jgi:hypothetical protein
MGYVLATNENIVRWYVFKDQSIATTTISYPHAVDLLDLKLVPQFHDKQTAKIFALAHGLQTWRYVKI